MKPTELSDRLLEFAARAAKVAESLPDGRSGRHVAGQLVRCCTSPAVNYEEACGAESRRDFTHKLAICLKEVRETRGWLRLIAKTELMQADRLRELIDESEQLSRILGKSIATAKGVAKRPD
ncbi:MAG: four helix bundle protein [Planctomycetota bacterium]